MKIIKSKDWEVIERIVSNFKFLEPPRALASRMCFETERLIDIYCFDEILTADFVKGNNYRIIYRDENSINDYEIFVTKVTDSYVYGIGGLIKYKKIRIAGVII